MPLVRSLRTKAGCQVSVNDGYRSLALGNCQKLIQQSPRRAQNRPGQARPTQKPKILQHRRVSETYNKKQLEMGFGAMSVSRRWPPRASQWQKMMVGSTPSLGDRAL